jgi:hypothetical protein
LSGGAFVYEYTRTVWAAAAVFATHGIGTDLAYTLFLSPPF